MMDRQKIGTSYFFPIRKYQLLCNELLRLSKVFFFPSVQVHSQRIPNEQIITFAVSFYGKFFAGDVLLIRFINRASLLQNVGHQKENDVNIIRIRAV